MLLHNLTRFAACLFVIIISIKKLLFWGECSRAEEMGQLSFPIGSWVFRMGKADMDLFERRRVDLLVVICEILPIAHVWALLGGGLDGVVEGRSARLGRGSRRESLGRGGKCWVLLIEKADAGLELGLGGFLDTSWMRLEWRSSRSLERQG